MEQRLPKQKLFPLTTADGNDQGVTRPQGVIKLRLQRSKAWGWAQILSLPQCLSAPHIEPLRGGRGCIFPAGSPPGTDSCPPPSGLPHPFLSPQTPPLPEEAQSGCIERLLLTYLEAHSVPGGGCWDPAAALGLVLSGGNSAGQRQNQPHQYPRRQDGAVVKGTLGFRGCSSAV